MAKVIWDQPGNPTKYVSDQLGIHRWELGKALHKIKAAGNLRGADRVLIYDDGTVTDERDEYLGDIYAELHKRD